MKRKIVPFLILIGLFAAGIAFSQSTLESIKKGNRGDKSWAVFAFDRKAVWIGLSQDNDGKVSLYFLGSAGPLDGSVVTVDPEYDRSILVRQIKESPPIFRADIGFEPDLPLSVLKKNGHVVVAFNDERLLDGSQILYGEGDAPPARLVSVTPSEDANRSTISMAFDGRIDWTGFARTLNRTNALFIRNAQMDNDPGSFGFADGTLQNLRFSPFEGEIPGIQARFTLAQQSRFNIALTGEALILSSPRASDNAGLFAAAGPEAAAPDAEIIAPARTETAPIVRTPSFAASAAAPDESVDVLIPWDQRVSFEFNSTPMRDALRLVAAANGLNMVISEGVQGKTTMKLERVTLRQALDKIIFTNDCNYYVDGNIITVRPITLSSTAGRITKIYRLRYADAVNVAKVVKRIATKDSLVEAFQSEFLDYNEAGKARIAYELSTVQGIRRSSILVVTDIPEKIKEINQVIAELDRPPIQVLIESKLVEVAPTYTNQLGIDWDKTLNLAYTKNETTDQNNLVVTSGTNASNPNFGLSRSLTMGRLNPMQYAAMIDFLKTRTNSKLMSNPRLLATDNEESSISVGKTVPVAQIQRGTGGREDMVTFDYKEISIRLNVTPHVGLNNEITMYVNPIIEEIVDWKILFGSEAPVTDKRSVNSIVTVRNGETVVIGGLVKNLQTETTKRLWLLGSLPLIGRLFQHESTQDLQTDLMIFITPTIVPASAG